MTSPAMEYQGTRFAPSKTKDHTLLKRLAYVTHLGPTLLTAVISTLAVSVAIRVWHIHLGIPIDYSGDALASGMNVKQMVVNGSWFTDSHLAAPYIQHFQDWPLPDIVSLAIARVLSIFTSNWAAVDNGMYLLSFPLCAMSAQWLFKKLGVSTWISIALGVLFSLLPYHHVRGESHLFLSNYFVVPFGIYLAVRVLSGEELFGRSQRYNNFILRYASLRTLQTVALGLLIGLDGIYYAAFTLMFVVVGLVARLLMTRRLRDVAPGLTVLIVLFAAVIFSTAPTIEYHLVHGSNPDAGERAASDTEVFGLKISAMLMPTDGHRIAAWDALQNKYYNTFPIPSERGSAALGIVGAIGLMWLLSVAILRVVRRSKDDVVASRHGQLAFFTVIALIVGTVGGISTMISLLVSPEIRSWNRISVFVAGFALCAIGLLLDRGLRLVKPHTLRPFVAMVAAGVVTIVGFLDQTTSVWIPPYATISQTFLNDQTYFHAIQSTMPVGANIYELPIEPFPEGPVVNKMGSYDEVKPYLQTSTLHWSFGGVKGRLESEWQDRLPAVTSTETANTFLQDIAAAGFTGLYIDGNASTDNAASLRALFDPAIGATPMVDSPGTKFFYDLRSYVNAQQQTNASALSAARQTILFPVFEERPTQPFGLETSTVDTGPRTWNWANGSSTEFPFYDAASSKTATHMSFAIQTSTATVATFKVVWPDGQTQTVKAGDNPVVLTRDLTMPTDRSELKISTSDAPRVPSSVDPRNLRFRINDLSLEPAS